MDLCNLIEISAPYSHRTSLGFFKNIEVDDIVVFGVNLDSHERNDSSGLKSLPFKFYNLRTKETYTCNQSTGVRLAKNLSGEVSTFEEFAKVVYQLQEVFNNLDKEQVDFK